MKIRALTLIATLILILVAVAIQSNPNPLFAGSPPSNGAVPLTTIEVNSTADVIADDGQCTLREAITAANADTASGTMAGECGAGNGYDLILIPAGHYLLTLVGGNENANATGDLDISDSVIIRGAGVRHTIIDGNGTDRVFHATAPRIMIEELVVTNGYVTGGDPRHGGGIAYIRSEGDGEFVVRRVAVRNNRAGASTSATPAGDGGGLYVYGGNIIIEHSEFSHNEAGLRPGPPDERPGYGGGVFIFAAVANTLITNSTISGNAADDSALGGGLYFQSTNGDLTIAQSTIVNNQTGTGGRAGGIHNTSSSITLRGTLIANNSATTSPDCNGIFTSQSGNLIGNVADCSFEGGEGDQTNVDPQVGVLQDNGGIGTYTHAPSFTSPAIDKGMCDDNTVDQRGLPRSVDMPGTPNGLSICDVGSHENAVPPGTATVTVSATATGTNTPTATNTPFITPTPGTPPPYILVNTTADGIADDGYCTLREAIRFANTGQSGGPQPGECFPHSLTIVVPAGHYKLTVPGANENGNLTGDLDINAIQGITLRGAGANQTIIDGNGLDRVFHIFVNYYGGQSDITLEDIAVINGQAPSGEVPHGGGIALDGFGISAVTLRRVAVRHNAAGDGTDTHLGGSGGGIYAQTRIYIEDSEISDNEAGARSNTPGAPAAGNGGGVYIYGRDGSNIGAINRTTISGNRVAANAFGGGIYLRRLWQNYSFPLVAVTITDNQIGDGMSGFGAGIAAMDTARVNLENVLIGGNRSQTGPDCFTIAATPFESRGGNLIGNDVDCFFTAATGDQLNVDPRLDPLRDNGGFGTHTHSLMMDSPAIDRGSCTATQDQRGYPRPVDMLPIPNGITTCDVGALEMQTLPGTPTITVTPSQFPTITPSPTATNTPTPTFTPSVTATTVPTAEIVVTSTEDVIAEDGFCTLREAIIAANEDLPGGSTPGECVAGSGFDTIYLPAGHYLLTRTGERENRGRQGDLDILTSITLWGAGRNSTIIDAQGIDRVMDVRSGVFNLEGVQLTGGQAPSGVEYGAAAESGGGIWLHDTATVTIADSTIRNNRAGDGAFGSGLGGVGGGIAQSGGSLTLRNVLIEANSGGNGGHPFPVPTPYPPYPGGGAGLGGGLYLTSNATIVDSTFRENTYGQPGAGGVPGEGGGIFAEQGVTIRGSTFVDNSDGFAVYAATVENSTFVGNGIGLVVRNGMEATGITVAYNGLGLKTLNFASLANSIIDQNDIQCEGTIFSQGYNLFGSGFDCELYGIQTGNQMEVDARLATLRDNGGHTHTVALLPDSPALDAGNCFGLTTDQRGFPRPSDLPGVPNVSDGCDIGAYEEQASPTPTPSPTATTPPSTITTLYLPLIYRAMP